MLATSKNVLFPGHNLLHRTLYSNSIVSLYSLSGLYGIAYITVLSIEINAVRKDSLTLLILLI